MVRRLVFLVGILALTAGTAPASASSGSSVVNSFYTWYFSVNATRAGWSGNFKDARPYLTASLFALIGKVLAEEKRSGGAVLDFDPFVDAQERAKSFSVGSASSTQSPANVPVTLHFGSVSQAGHLTVVVRNDSGWRIDNLVYGSQGNLRTIIAAAMK